MRLPPKLRAECLALAGEPAKPKRKRKHYDTPKPAVCLGTEPRVTLPLPPSANELFVCVRNRRVKTREYRDWIAAALPLCRRLRPPASLPCTFFFVLEGRVNIQRDGANCEKALTDLCVRAGVIPDDSLKYVLSGYWQAQLGPGEPAVNIWFEPFGQETGGGE